MAHTSRTASSAPAEAPPLGEHLDATYRWLCRAQDATADGGVSGYFDLWGGCWAPSYPETTGYIIPSFLALADARSDDDARARALRMADWSSQVQLQDGAVTSGLIGLQQGPAVFNTGQAIFGWLAAYEASGEQRYAQSARTACEWLLSQQDTDGAWRRSLSAITSAPVHTYNGRCAWALAYAATVLEEPRFRDGALRAGDWVLTQQNGAGWFAHNGFSETEVPLLHTISYVIEGLVGMYAFTGDERYLNAARRAVDAVVMRYRAGMLAGRFDERWQGTVPWRCPTGEAQVAVVLHRLERLCPGNDYGATAGDLTADVARVQRTLVGRARLGTDAGPEAGGVPGSFPIWSEYMRFRLPNWAAKFFLDALVLELLGVDEKGFPATVHQAS